MAQRETITIALRAPVAKPYTKDGQEKKLWNIVSSDGKQRYICFDEKLVEAFEKAKLENKDHEYIIIPSSDAGRDPMLIEIPGIYEKKRGGSSTRGPLLTDRQTALLAAAIRGGPIEELTKQADRLMAWLGGEAPPAFVQPSQAQRSPTSAEVKAERTRMERVYLLRKLQADLDVDADKILAYYGQQPGSGFESLTLTQLNEAIDRLEKRLQTEAAKEAS